MEVKLRSKKFGYRLHSVLSVFITVHCSGFTTYAVINPPGYELANRTSVHGKMAFTLSNSRFSRIVMRTKIENDPGFNIFF